MALVADAFSPLGIEARRMDDRVGRMPRRRLSRVQCPVRVARSVAILAADRHFEEGGVLVPVETAPFRRHPAGMAPQAFVDHTAIEAPWIVLRITGSEVPLARLRVPVERRHA